MRLYIPEIKDQITLTKDWEFTLYPENRNEKFGVKLGLAEETDKHYRGVFWAGEFSSHQCHDYNREQERWVYNLLFSVKLEKGTILQIDRIYIRKGKGKSEYSSITFYIKNGPYKGARFWAKLKEVNEIEFEHL